jgi:hypothetical protein
LALNTPAGPSSDWVERKITKPSGRETRPPAASRMMASARGRLPNTQSSSTRTKAAFLPETTSVSAATTFSTAWVVRWVIWRRCSWMCSRSRSLGSARIMSRAGKKALLATSRVGASSRSSAERRQLRTRAVTMMPAAMVDLEFFLLISRKNSRISRRPAAAS